MNLKIILKMKIHIESFQKMNSENNLNNIPSGVSIESASYMENNNLAEKKNITNLSLKKI